MADFVSLKNEVLAMVIDTPSSVQTYVPTFINRAIRKLQAKHDFKVMEAEISFVTTPDTRVLGPRPSDWKKSRGQPYFIEDLGGFIPMSWASNRQEPLAAFGNDPDVDTGSPQVLFEDDLPGELDFYPYSDTNSDYSDGEYRITVPYWKYLGNLIADSDSNWFTTNAEDYIVFRATSFAFWADHDEERAQIWLQRANQEYHDILLLDKDRRLADLDTLVMHTGALPPHLQR